MNKRVYEVLIEDVCDSFQGRYANKETAITKAKEEYELLNKKYTIIVNELEWSNEEEDIIQMDDSIVFILTKQ